MNITKNTASKNSIILHALIVIALSMLAFLFLLFPYLLPSTNNSFEQNNTSTIVNYFIALLATVNVTLPLLFKLFNSDFSLKTIWNSTLFITSLCGGYLIFIAYKNYQILEEPHIGLSNLYQVSVLLIFAFGSITLWWAKKHLELLNFTSPILLLASLFLLWLESIGHANATELVPALKSYWLPWHVAANFVGYGAFFLASAAATMHLFALKSNSNKLPSAKICKKITISAISFGFPFFTLAIILGSLWANEAWGGYWSWDPKETWSLIVWLFYGGILHAAKFKVFSDKTISYLSIFGFFITLFCYIGVNMFLSGLHSYGQLN